MPEGGKGHSGILVHFAGLFPCKHAPGNDLIHNAGDQRHGQCMTGTKADSKSDTVKAKHGLTSKVS